AAAAELEIPGVSAKVRPVPTGTSKFDLTLSLSEEPGAEGEPYLGGHLEYDSALFDEASAVRLGRQLEALLAGAVADPDRRLSELSPLAESESRQLVREERRTVAPDLAEARAETLRSPTEELLAGIWEEVLEIGGIAADADFFDLGGHSLRAARVVLRVREVFAVDLPLHALFEAPGLAAFAARIEAERGMAPTALPPISPVSRHGALPLSSAQERLWFLDRLDSGSPVYNIPFALAFSGDLRVPVLAAALG